MSTYDEIEYKTYLLKHKKKQNRGANRSQDSERLKTYRAEWAFLSQYDAPEFKDLAEAQKFAKKIYKSKTWSKLWQESVNGDVTRIFASSPAIIAKQRSSGRGTAGHTNGHTVTLDMKVGLNVYTLLHELSHSFRQCLLKMVSRFMGREAASLLKAEFKKAKLACGEPRKPLTFEQWKAARDRMSKMREQL